jgi:hypothetical protein
VKSMRLAGLSGLLISAAFAAYAAAPAEVPEPTQHEFVVKSFKTPDSQSPPSATMWKSSIPCS